MKNNISSIEEIINRIELELKKDKSNRVIEDNNQKSYTYLDFMQYKDIIFIKKVFMIILKRDADKEGLNYYLRLLRSKKRTKEEIITEIRCTDEGKKVGVKIKGLWLKYIIFIFNKVFKLINISKYIKIISKDKINNKNRDKFNNFYIAFENKFRGNRVEIKDRLEIYLPYIEKASRKDGQILDIGCGRGEWLELLEENGFFNIKGVDINPLMVEISQNFGFDVIEIDTINYLNKLKSKSLEIITGFHIIEHLSFEDIMQLFEESYRVLKDGGVIIFETPNPENLIVGACNFYTDMTHFNPLVPRTIEFLAEYIGFKDIEIKRLHPRGEPSKLTDLKLKEVVDWMNCGQDYAVIGYKY